MDKILLKTTK